MGGAGMSGGSWQCKYMDICCGARASITSLFFNQTCVCIPASKLLPPRTICEPICVSLAVSVHNVVFHSILHQKRQGGQLFVDTTLLKIASISDFFNRACFIGHLPEKATSVSQLHWKPFKLVDSSGVWNYSELLEPRDHVSARPKLVATPFLWLWTVSDGALRAVENNHQVSTKIQLKNHPNK